MSTHDGPAATSRRAAVREREDALVARLQTLDIDGEPDPAFRAVTRQRLVAMAAVRTPGQQVGRPSLFRRLVARADDAPPARWRGRLTAGLATAALTVTALATLVAVSSGAHPGDVLYGLKRGTEQTQLALAGDSRGQTLLDFAGTRLQEVRALGSDGDAALAVSTLHTMDQQTTDGSAWLAHRAVQTRSSAPIHDLTAWSATQRAGLADLQALVPPAARDAAAASLDLLDRVDARATALVPALSCSSGPAVRGSDALGPVPVACGSGPVAAGTGTGPGAQGAQVPSGAKAGSGVVPPGAATATGAAGAGSGTGPPNGGISGTDPGSLLPGGGSGSPSSPSSVITVPLPTLPPLPLPGSQPSGSGSGTTGSTGGASPSGGLGVCLPPVLQVGNC